MPNLGELLRSVLEGAGQGAMHREAQRTRGGDYLAKEEAANTAARTTAFGRAKVAREFNVEDATARALSELAQQGGLESSGDPVQDAAMFKALQELKKNGLSQRLTESQISANESLVDTRAHAPEEKEADRLLREKLAGENADLRKFLLMNRPQPPQIVLVPQADGSMVAQDKRGMKSGQVVGQRPVPAGEQRKRAEGVAMTGLGERAAAIPDEFLGPTSKFKAGMRQGMIGDVFGMDEPPPEYTDAQAVVGELRDLKVHALTGAAASVPEMRRLMTHIPDMGQRPNVFRSNVKVYLAGLEVAEKVNSGEIAPEQASLLMQRLLGSRPGAAPMSPGQPTGGGATDRLGLF